MRGRQRRLGRAPGTPCGAGECFSLCHTAELRRPEFVALAGGKLRDPLGGRV